MKFGRKPGSHDEAGKAPGAESDAPSRKLDISAAGKPKSRNKTPKRGYLDGQMLIAMPTMGDERFARSVIYVCAHSSEGAMGIVVNHPAAQINFRDLLVQLDVVNDNDKIQLP